MNIINQTLQLNAYDSRMINGKAIDTSSYLGSAYAFFADLFSRFAFRGWQKARDIEEYKALEAEISPLLGRIKDLENKKNFEFYSNIQVLLRVKGKIDASGWKKNLEEDKDSKARYKQFSQELLQWQGLAKESISAYLRNEKSDCSHAIDKKNFERWFFADEDQIKFSAYSNNIAYYAHEIPAGAILLLRPEGTKALLKIKKVHARWVQKIQFLKAWFCAKFTGLALTHAMISTGNGHFIHMDKDNESSHQSIKGCSGILQFEDWSQATIKDRSEAKKDRKLMHNYDIVFPKKEEFKSAGIDDTDAFFKGPWLENIKKLNEKTPFKARFQDILSVALPSKRSKDYDAKNILKTRHEAGKGFACSGFIAASLASQGIDLDSHRMLERFSPTDFKYTKFYQTVYEPEA